jgi:hypothetical protein
MRWDSLIAIEVSFSRLRGFEKRMLDDWTQWIESISSRFGAQSHIGDGNRFTGDHSRGDCMSEEQDWK